MCFLLTPSMLTTIKWAYKSQWSIDGLPGMQRGLDASAKYGVEPLVKMVSPLETAIRSP